MLSSVVLPQPLGPTRQTNSDSAALKLASLTASTLPPGVSYSRVTSFTRITP